MKYGYTVKANGVYYPAGMEVPDFDVEKKAEVKKPSALLDEEEAMPKRKAGRPPKKEQ